MKHTLNIILFVVLGGLLIWSGLAYTHKVDRDAETATAQQQIDIKEQQKKDMEKLTINDVVVGTGAEAVSGKTVTVQYTGTLENGKKFDSSYDHGTPFTVTIGIGKVIKGWDLGIVGMKVGGTRNLTIPPELAYGASGAGDIIPPNATLHFTVELLDVK